MEDLDDLQDMGAPNCPNDLTAMDAEEVAGHVRWVCPQCGLVRL